MNTFPVGLQYFLSIEAHSQEDAYRKGLLIPIVLEGTHVYPVGVCSNKENRVKVLIYDWHGSLDLVSMHAKYTPTVINSSCIEVSILESEIFDLVNNAPGSKAILQKGTGEVDWQLNLTKHSSWSPR